jgi:hypothetical protein
MTRSAVRDRLTDRRAEAESLVHVLSSAAIVTSLIALAGDLEPHRRSADGDRRQPEHRDFVGMEEQPAASPDGKPPPSLPRPMGGGRCGCDCWRAALRFAPGGADHGSHVEA